MILQAGLASMPRSTNPTNGSRRDFVRQKVKRNRLIAALWCRAIAVPHEIAQYIYR